MCKTDCVCGFTRSYFTQHWTNNVTNINKQKSSTMKQLITQHHGGGGDQTVTVLISLILTVDIC